MEIVLISLAQQTTQKSTSSWKKKTFSHKKVMKEKILNCLPAHVRANEAIAKHLEEATPISSSIITTQKDMSKVFNCLLRKNRTMQPIQKGPSTQI